MSLFFGALFSGIWRFITAVVALVVKYPWQAALLATVLIAAWLLQGKNNAISHAQGQRNAAVMAIIRIQGNDIRDIAQWHGNANRLRTSLDRQNEQVAFEHTQLLLTQLALTRARVNADQAAVVTDRYAARVRAAEARLRAANPNDNCAAPLALIRGEH